MTCTCGYDHPYNARQFEGVRFISRYRGENDYCVNGRRIGLSDDGIWKREPSEQEKAGVLAWEKEFNT